MLRGIGKEVRPPDCSLERDGDVDAFESRRCIEVRDAVFISGTGGVLVPRTILGSKPEMVRVAPPTGAL